MTTVGTWNVRFLNWKDDAVELVNVIIKLKADLTAFQELRWTGNGRRKVSPREIYYSVHTEVRNFG